MKHDFKNIIFAYVQVRFFNATFLGQYLVVREYKKYIETLSFYYI